MAQCLKEVVQLFMVMAKQNKKKGLSKNGGLLVLIWMETDPEVRSFKCTVAAAGPWCLGIQMEELHPVFTDLMNRLCLCPGSCPEPDLEDLCVFTDLHGPLNVFLSFSMSNPEIVRPNWHHQIETFVQMFSLTNMEIHVQLKLRLNKKLFQHEYRVGKCCFVPVPSNQPLSLDVTVKTDRRKYSQSSARCHGGYPEMGESLSLSIPPKVMEQGLFGNVTLQPASLLSPCALHDPNAGANLTELKVLIYSPSNVPFTTSPAFMHNLPAHINLQEMGLQGSHLRVQDDCKKSSSEVIPCGGTAYKVEQVDCHEISGKSSVHCIDQSLVLFLFLKYTDPFMADIADIMDTEMRLELHLEDILNHNRDSVTDVVKNELKKILTIQDKKKNDREKVQSACDVVTSSILSIFSRSSNMEFRNTCLNNMKVQNTLQLSTAISESFNRRIFFKFAPKKECRAKKIRRQLKKNKHRKIEK